MLTFTVGQWQALREDEAQRFVAAVADQLITGRPGLQEKRAVVLKRLSAMHRLASEAGLTSSPHIIRLLHLAAGAPGLHQDPDLRAWLSRPGQSPEQRLDDLLAVVDHHLQGAR